MGLDLVLDVEGLLFDLGSPEDHVTDVPSVTIHLAVSAGDVGEVAMSSAALVLLRGGAAADLVTGSHVCGLHSHTHHGEGDQHENEGGLDGGHFSCLFRLRGTFVKRCRFVV